MATISYPVVLLGLASLCFLFQWVRNRNSPAINWPVVGMLPGLLWNLRRVHDHLTSLLQQSGGTFKFKGPWFCNFDFVLTSDPMNTHHILSQSFSNFSKGPDFGAMFEPLGEGILAVDSESWKFQRKMIHSYVKGSKFQVFLERTVYEKVANSLFPVLDHVCAHETEVDMEDVFLRFGFDIIFLLIFGSDPGSLSIEFPEVPYEKAITDLEEGILYRHAVPGRYWRLLRWLKIGRERKFSADLKILDDFVYESISSKREKHLLSPNKTEQDSFDFLTYLMEEDSWTKEVAKNENKFLRDVATNMVAAGRDTSSATLGWFFWLLSMNPSVETKILEEIKQKLPRNGKEELQTWADLKGCKIFSTEELSKLVYLHAALCETLRLYPSVPVNHKCAVKQDTLPNGLYVSTNTKIFMSFYAMGRMEEIWGKDCYEFKPERWVSESGGIVHVPSYKFPAFNAGPRSCLGKDMSFVQMKIVAVAVLLNYGLRVVEDHPVEPSTSVILHMKHGFRVRVNKRCIS